MTKRPIKSGYKVCLKYLQHKRTSPVRPGTADKAEQKIVAA